MSTNYIYGTVLTGEAVAANNRGENIGNTNTLQKVFHHDEIHTSVSAEAIRFAFRYRFQLEHAHVNRRYECDTGRLTYEDEKRESWKPGGNVFVDDDIMGFMDAEAARQEKEDDEPEEGYEGAKRPAKPPKSRAKGKATKRQSPLAVGRAVSLRPYRGEISFNCVSGEKVKGKLSLYHAEMHTTEYQYSFGLNLNDVTDKVNIGHLLDAIVDPPFVGGNHARFAYDFSPQTIVFRITHAHSSRIQNCFEHDEHSRRVTAAGLIRQIESGDIPAYELIIGGGIADAQECLRLKSLGVKVIPGVRSALNEAKDRIAGLGIEYRCLAVAKEGAR
jgi:CRISPR-associated protein Cst2